jgi:hypothetical protein
MLRGASVAFSTALGSALAAAAFAPASRAQALRYIW